LFPATETKSDIENGKGKSQQHTQKSNTKLIKPILSSRRTDAISVSLSVRQIVSKMCSIDRYGLSIGQHSHIVPVGLLVSKTWPTVGLGFNQKVIHGATNGSCEKKLSGVGIVEFNGL
jgi:hypothetical protein